jgi:hypothetical protein
MFGSFIHCAATGGSAMPTTVPAFLFPSDTDRGQDGVKRRSGAIKVS